MTRSNWHAYDHYAYAAVAVLGTLFAVGVLSWLMMASPLSGWTRGLAGVQSPFTNVLGVLFGLTLAFLANDTWNAHDRARAAILREADAIRSLDVLATPLPAPARDALRRTLSEYVVASAAEWPALARCATHDAATDAADRLLAEACMANGPGPAVQDAMLREVAAIRASRDRRIGLSRTHVNPLKWLVMAFLGFLTLVSVAVVHADDPQAALIAMIIFGLAAAPTAAIVLIHGNPFQPPSAVSPALITSALRGLSA